MLSLLSLEGVKAFSSKATLHLAPCTVITGRNSSGKSSLFQVLLLLKQAFARSPRLFAGIHLNGALVSIGTYEDWSSDHKLAPVHVGLEVRGQLSAAAGPRTVRWWKPARAAQGPQTVKADLELELAAAKGEATSAHLERFIFHAQVIGEAEKSDYRVAFNQRPEPDLREHPLLPEDDRSLRYRFVASHTRDSVRDLPAGKDVGSLELGSSGVCAIEGLQATRLFAITAEDAAPHTVSQGLSQVFEPVMKDLAGIYGARGSRQWRPDTVTLSGDAGPEHLAKVRTFFATSPADAFIYYCALNPEVFSLLPVWCVARPHEPAWASVAAAFYGRFEESYDRAPSAAVTADVARSTEAIATASPVLAAPCRLLARLTRVDVLTPAAVSQLSALLARAAEQALGSLHSLRSVQSPREALAPKAAADTKPVQDSRSADFPSEQVLQVFFEDYLFHLGPLREEPRNIYSAEPPISRADVGPRGERAVECLRRFGQEPIEAPVPEARGLRSQSLMAAVIDWARYLELIGDVTIADQSKYGTVIQVTTPGADASKMPVYADLTNVGVGVSQLLPVIVLCLGAPDGATVLIEQPELHLHPAVQVKLAELLTACTASGRQIVVESHSEHLLNGIRLQVARLALSPSDLAVAYVARDELGVEIQPIRVEADGSLSARPRGFFDESERLLRDLLAARLAK